MIVRFVRESKLDVFQRRDGEETDNKDGTGKIERGTPRHNRRSKNDYASVDYDLARVFHDLRDTYIKVDLQNLTDVTKIDYNPGTTLNGENLYWTVPGRSAFVTLSTTF